VGQDLTLRRELVKLLSGGGAHAGFEKAVEGLPAGLRGMKPEGAAHTAWELLEHMRIAQRDMLEFSRNPASQSPDWPAGYWPSSPTPPSSHAWDNSVAAFRADLGAMRALVDDPNSDLFTPFAHGTGQSLLRETLQVADHNAYHVGELVFLRRLLGAWKPD
jgi:hypothetical protein